MEGREAMSFPGAHPPFYFPRGAFTSIPASQSASALHAPPGFSPMTNPNLQPQPQHLPLSSSGHQFPFGEQRHQEDFRHGIHMGMAASSPPTMQQPQIPPTSPPPPQVAAATEPVVKKKRGRPRKYVPDHKTDLGLSPMPSSEKTKDSSSMSDPNAPKRARGRPPGTGRKQRLANLSVWMNSSAGLAFAPHVISVEAGEDIVAKVLSFSQQRPRALCIMSGTGTVASVTLCESGSSVPTRFLQGPFEMLSLGGSYLVNEEGGPKSRTGGISVSLSSSNGFVIGGGVGTLIAATLVQVVACSFVYGSAKAKVMKQENGSKEDNTTQKDNSVETPDSESLPPEAAAEAAAEAVQTPQDFSSPGWSGSGGGKRSIDSRDDTDIDLTRG
uniref:AT-hook motif nuclear-localized protein n=1 Tax=Noccaea caerulescens TaxID=107243 RepID=A0A1J3IKD7_NOCCA